MADSVNPLVAGWQIWRAMRATPPPRPAGTATADHGGLSPVLDALRRGGIEGFDRQDLRDYLDYASSVDPDALSRDHALAYWVNHYNAHAIDLARSALDEGKASVLAFDSAFTADVDVEGLAGCDGEGGRRHSADNDITPQHKQTVACEQAK